jgi:hypothetical protein
VRAAALLPENREDELGRLASALEEAHTDPGCQSALLDSGTEYTPVLELHGVTALEDKLQVSPKP